MDVSSFVLKKLIPVVGDYASVKQELKGIISAVPQANILLHDTFYQSTQSGYNIGPYQAMKSVLKTMPHKFRVISQNSGLPGITFLWQCPGIEAQ